MLDIIQEAIYFRAQRGIHDTNGTSLHAHVRAYKISTCFLYSPNIPYNWRSFATAPRVVHLAVVKLKNLFGFYIRRHKDATSIAYLSAFEERGTCCRYHGIPVLVL
jgi:hypothetical protein